MAEAAASEKEESKTSDREQSEQGREFYTIQTASEKVFYLIIDRDGEEEVVYFLTEISENDLLNVTSDNSETLPKNSAALESAIPVTEGALSNNNTENQTQDDTGQSEGEDTEQTEETKPSEEVPVKQENPVMTYAVFCVLAAAAVGTGYYFKVVRKKKEQFLDEDDEDEEEEEVFEEEEDTDSEDDFFSDDEGEE